MAAHSLRLISENADSNRLLWQPWRAVDVAGNATDLTEMGCPSHFAASEWCASKLVEAAAAENASPSEFGRLFRERASQQDFSGVECEAWGPQYGLRKVAETAGSIEEISRFAEAGAKLNILRNCDARLRAVASGPRRRVFFRYATGRPHFPPTEEGVLAWSSFSTTERSFQIYTAHLEQAGALLGLSISSKTRAVATASHGLAKAGDRTSCPRPAVTREHLSQITLSKGRDDAIAVVALSSWAFQ